MGLYVPNVDCLTSRVSVSMGDFFVRILLKNYFGPAESGEFDKLDV
ncbi:MAG: hypothetical protein ACI9ON_000094 [Limisphaerales bacterium]|jgi:hypothetical protein